MSLENTRRCPVTMNIKTGEQNVDEVKPGDTETHALSLGKQRRAHSSVVDKRRCGKNKSGWRSLA